MVIDLEVLAAAYLLGTIPFAYILLRLFGMRILAYGTDRPEIHPDVVTLYTRAGPLLALLSLLFNAAKGAVAVLLAREFSPNPVLPLLAGLLAATGHNWAVWLGFEGGKGFVPTVGALSILTPWLAPFYFAVIVIAAGIFNKNSTAAALVAAAALPPVFWIYYRDPLTLWIALAWALVLISKDVTDVRTILIRKRQG